MFFEMGILKHGHTRRNPLGNRRHTLIYECWSRMISRCSNPKGKDFKHYGGRGISVCGEWKDFSNFLRDMQPTWKKGLTLERDNVHLGYSKSNCRWASQRVQTRNKRNNIVLTIEGRSQVLADWAQEYGVKYLTAYARFKKGWPNDRIFGQQKGRLKIITITLNGISRPLAEYCREFRLNYSTVASRLEAGWPVSKALTKI